MTTVRVERLQAFAASVLRAAGVPGEDADIAAEAMAWSDLRGSPTHGVTWRLPQFVERIRHGAVNPAPRWTQTRAVLDADRGWGQIAGTRAMRSAIAAARESGIGMMLVRDADVTSSMGWYANVAVQDGFVGLAINNTMPLMAPWGGTTKLLGNQAFAIGAPAGRHESLLFDSAVTAMSNSGVNVAARRGSQLPPGVALDGRGEPTTDPAEALAGIMLPMGGHRGFGLALMWEVLTGVLSGGRMAPGVGGPAQSGEPMGVSMCCVAIDPSAVMPPEDFAGRVDSLIGLMHSSPASGTEPVRVPGERGGAMAAIHSRDGVEIPADRIDGLRALGNEFGVPWA